MDKEWGLCTKTGNYTSRQRHQRLTRRGLIYQLNGPQEKLPGRQEWKEHKDNSTKHESPTV